MKKYFLRFLLCCGFLWSTLLPVFAMKWYIADQQHEKLQVLEEGSPQSKEIVLPDTPMHLTNLNNTVYVTYAHTNYISKITDDQKENEDIKIEGVPGRLIAYKGKVFCAQETGVKAQSTLAEIDSKNNIRKIPCDSSYFPRCFAVSSHGLFIGAKNKMGGKLDGAIFKLDESASPTLIKLAVTSRFPHTLTIGGKNLYSFDGTSLQEYNISFSPIPRLEGKRTFSPQTLQNNIPGCLINYKDRVYFSMSNNENIGEIDIGSSSRPQYQPLGITRSLGYTVYANQLVLGAKNKNKYELLMLEEITDGEQKKLIIMDRKEISHRPSAIVGLNTGQ